MISTKGMFERMAGRSVKTECVGGQTGSLDRASRLLVWVVFFATIVGMLTYWFVHDIQPYRVPPAWDETCYMNATLTAYETAKTSWLRFLGLFTQSAMCVGHATFVGTWFALPLLLTQGARYELVFLASVIMTGVGAVLIALATYVTEKRDEAALAGALSAGWYYLFAPMTLGCAAIYYSEAPLAVAFPASVVAYLCARRRRALGAWMIASVVLFTCLYVRAERGLPCIAMMMIAYCVDELRVSGWRAARDAACTMLGLGTLSLLGLQRVLPDWDSASVVSLAANMLGIIVVLYCASYWLKPSSATRRALAYALPVWVLLMLWFAHQNNATHTFTTLKMFLDRDAAAPRLFSYPLVARFVHRYSGTVVGGYVKLALAAVGTVVAAWRWPGLVALTALAIASTAKLNEGVGARYLYHFHLVAAMGGGLAATTITRWLARWVGSTIGLRKTLVVVLPSVLLLVLQVPGIFAIARKTFEGKDCTYWIMFDKQRTYWSILDVAREQIPRFASFSHFPGLPALENGAMRLYGRVHKLGWWSVDLTILDDIIQPLNVHERARGIMPAYVVVTELTTQRLYDRVASSAEVARVCELLQKHSGYASLCTRTLTNGEATVHVFNRKNKGE